MAVEDLLRELIETQKETNKLLSSNQDDTKTTIKVAVGVFFASSGFMIIIWAFTPLLDMINYDIAKGIFIIVFAVIGIAYFYVGFRLINSMMPELKGIFKKQTSSEEIKSNVIDINGMTDIQKEILARLDRIEQKSNDSTIWGFRAIGLAYLLFGMTILNPDNISLAVLTIILGIVIILARPIGASFRRLTKK
jgi:hypothetical protein